MEKKNLKSKKSKPFGPCAKSNLFKDSLYIIGPHFLASQFRAVLGLLEQQFTHAASQSRHTPAAAAAEREAEWEREGKRKTEPNISQTSTVKRKRKDRNW